MGGATSAPNNSQSFRFVLRFRLLFIFAFCTYKFSFNRKAGIWLGGGWKRLDHNPEFLLNLWPSAI